jgi:Transketolase, thiamine diphosphate binding domain
MSATDLMAVLLDGHLRLDYGHPADPRNDHLIFSKGHASPLYYAVLKAAGAIEDEELLAFRRLHSRLEGHPTPRIPPTDVATGSLGQGLPIGVGVAMAAARLDRLPYRVWVLCGDSEMAEGSMWEAFQHASWEGLDNIVAIVDVNRLGQTSETMLGWDLEAYANPVHPGIELPRAYLQPISGGRRAEDVSIAKCLTQPRDVNLNRLDRVGGRLIAPCAGPGSPDTWLVNAAIMPWRPDGARCVLGVGCGSRGVRAASARCSRRRTGGSGRGVARACRSVRSRAPAP